MIAYKLVNKRVVECKPWECDWSILTRRVGLDTLPSGREVSTVFTVVGPPAAEVPMVFETMVFDPGGKNGELMCRYCCWEWAEKGHANLVNALKEGGILLPVSTSACSSCRRRTSWAT